jgi:molybdopterin synthase sulfur carrier subunit
MKRGTEASQAVTSISILYFAWVRERVGTGAEVFDLPATVRTVGALVETLKRRGPGFEAAFALPNLVRAAVNQDFAGADMPVQPGDEVAFFPPVTGG